MLNSKTYLQYLSKMSLLKIETLLTTYEIVKA